MNGDSGGSPRELLTSFRHRLGGDLLEGAVTDEDIVRLQVATGGYRRAAEELLAHSLDRLEFITCLDRETHFELIVQAYSMKGGTVVRMSTTVERDRAEMPTLSDLWPPAGWEERETFDQFGVRFLDHPDLRRILNPDRWVGHPLRKDYQDPAVVDRPDYL